MERVAQRYRGQVQWYEIWNEPHPGERFDGHRGFFTGSMDDLLDLAQRAQAVIRRVDPQARVLTPGFVNRLPLLERYLAAGGKLHADGLAYHLYARGDRDLVVQVKALRGILARQGLAHWPIFNTESSYSRWPDHRIRPPDVPTFDAETAAALYARSMILGAFMGVHAWYLHGWDNEDSGAVDRQLRPTALMAPYIAVRRWLLGLTPLGCRSLRGELLRCEAHQVDGQRLTLLWRLQPGAVTRMKVEGAIRIEFVDREATIPDSGAAATVDVGMLPVAVWSPPLKQVEGR